MTATHTEIRSADTSYSAATAAGRKLAAMPVRASLLLMLLPAMIPAMAAAKGETTRIEVARGKRPFLTLADPQIAGQFTIWTGPGTSTGPSDLVALDGAEHDIADWAGGPVEPPANLTVYKVRFFCAADASTPRETATSHQCYGMYYGLDPVTHQAFVQIPPEQDKQFPDNTRSIYRGVEGRWYRASARWETVVRPQIEAELATGPNDTYRWWEHQPAYTQPASSRTAVSATPRV